jgi:hypothetical protein
VIVIPEKSSKDDITRTALIVRMCRDAGKGKSVVGVVNEVPTDKKSYVWKRAQEIKDGLAEFGLPVVVIHSRDQFVMSKDMGSGVHEMGGRATAAKNEIESLYQVIVAKLGFDGAEQ